MTKSFRPMSLIGAALVALGASVGTAEAIPIAQVGVAAAGIDQAAYLHRRYPGYYSRSARIYRYARRNSPNRYCRNQPSRCR